MSEADNARRDPKNGYEVWYLTWNDPDTGEGYWLRYVIELGHAELWFARFDPRDPRKTFGVHKTLPLLPPLQIGDAVLAHDHARGSLTGAGHDVTWDLRWAPSADTLRQLPDVMYARGGLGETTVLSPNPRVPLSGLLTVDGEQRRFEHVPAGQTHLWGRKHAFSWMWGRCAQFAGSDAVLEVLCTRLQRRGILLPPLTIATLWENGRKHRLNQFRHTLVNRGTWRPGHAHFTAWSPRIRLECELTCRDEQLIDAPYVDPDGTEVWCQNTEIGDARLVIRELGQATRTLVGRGTAHFETGGRARAPQVERVHTRA